MITPPIPSVILLSTYSTQKVRSGRKPIGGRKKTSPIVGRKIWPDQERWQCTQTWCSKRLQWWRRLTDWHASIHLQWNALPWRRLTCTLASCFLSILSCVPNSCKKNKRKTRIDTTRSIYSDSNRISLPFFPVFGRTQFIFVCLVVDDKS